MIRSAVPADLITCARIYKQGFHGDDRLPLRWFLRTLASPGTRLVVDDPGMGVIRGWMLTQEYDVGTVVTIIAVAAEARKQGVGTGLLATISGPGGAWVREENVASRTMFERAGWRLAVSEWAEPKKPENHSGRWVCYVKD